MNPTYQLCFRARIFGQDYDCDDVVWDENGGGNTLDDVYGDLLEQLANYATRDNVNGEQTYEWVKILLREVSDNDGIVGEVLLWSQPDG